MKIYVFFIICCAATIFAAPANEEGEAGIHVEVKPVDLQIKIPPSNIEVTVSKEKQSSTSTTTKLPTEKPEEEDKIEEPPNSPNDKVNHNNGQFCSSDCIILLNWFNFFS